MPAVAANELLNHLPDATRTRLRPRLEQVSLQRRDVLFRAHEPLSAVYFPQSAVVSLVSTLRSGQSLEVGLVGRDGVAGQANCHSSARMTCDGVVQIGGSAFRIGHDVLQQELAADDALNAGLCRFGELLLTRSMQLSVCNRFHAVEQRCIRWLLTMNDLLDEHDIPLTHEQLAAMLGVRRPTVTLVLRTLAAANLVDETRGQIVLRNLRGLEEACCECYGLLRHEQQRLLGY